MSVYLNKPSPAEEVRILQKKLEESLRQQLETQKQLHQALSQLSLQSQLSTQIDELKLNYENQILALQAQLQAQQTQQNIESQVDSKQTDSEETPSQNLEESNTVISSFTLLLDSFMSLDNDSLKDIIDNKVCIPTNLDTILQRFSMALSHGLISLLNFKSISNDSKKVIDYDFVLDDHPLIVQIKKVSLILLDDFKNYLNGITIYLLTHKDGINALSNYTSSQEHLLQFNSFEPSDEVSKRFIIPHDLDQSDPTIFMKYLTSSVLKGNIDFDSRLVFYVMASMRIDWFKTIVKHGADLEESYKDISPLMHAILVNFTEAIDILLENNVNVNSLCPHGQSALMYVCMYSRDSSILIKLIEHGANLDLQDSEGKTALIYAAQYGDYDNLELLLTNKANPEIKDLSGWNALMHAIYNGNVSCLKLLLDKGDQQLITNDVLYKSLVSFAASNNQLECLSVLIESGAPILKLNEIQIDKAIRYTSENNLRTSLKVLLTKI